MLKKQFFWVGGPDGALVCWRPGAYVPIATSLWPRTLSAAVAVQLCYVQNARDQGVYAPNLKKNISAKIPPRIKVCSIGIIRNTLFTPTEDQQTPCTAHAQICEDVDLEEWRFKY